MREPVGTRGSGLAEGLLARNRARMVRRLLPADLERGRVLDLGCGHYPYFLLNCHFAERFGVEQELGDEQAAALREQGLTVLQGDLEAPSPLPFADRQFDLITMLAVLEHIAPARVPDLLAEVQRLLKPGGLFVLTTPALWTPPLLTLLAHLHLVSEVEIKDHKAAYGLADLAPLLAAAGFPRAELRWGYFQFLTSFWLAARK